MTMSTKKPVKVMGCGDIHWSMRDEAAVDVFSRAIKMFKPDIFVFGGDLLNCGPFSRHAKTKLDEDDAYDYLEGELSPATDFLIECSKHAGKTVVLEGNHDEWFERWLMRNRDAAQAFGSIMPSRYIKRHIKCTYIPFTGVKGDGECVYRLTKDLMVCHGWAANKYAANKHLELAKNKSVIFHHTHRMQTTMGSTFDGDPLMAMSAGCLCKRRPVYAMNGSPTEWVHGFWVTYLGKHGFTPYPVLIDNRYSAVLPDGRQIK